MNLMKWPKQFKRGIPKEEGCYVCIVYDNQQYGLKLLDVEEYGLLYAEAFGEKPGLFVDEYLEGDPVPVADFGIVGYLKLDGIGVLKTWQCDGFEE